MPRLSKYFRVYYALAPKIQILDLHSCNLSIRYYSCSCEASTPGTLASTLSSAGPPSITQTRRNSILKDSREGSQFKPTLHDFQLKISLSLIQMFYALAQTSFIPFYLEYRCREKNSHFSNAMEHTHIKVLDSSFSITIILYLLSSSKSLTLPFEHYRALHAYLLIFKFHFLCVTHLCRTLPKRFQFVFSLFFC